MLKKLEIKINAKGMTERRLREFRQFYKIYPQLSQEIDKFVPLLAKTLQNDGGDSIRRTLSAELQTSPAVLIKRLPYSHLLRLSKIENNIQRTFYELEAIKGIC